MGLYLSLILIHITSASGHTAVTGQQGLPQPPLDQAPTAPPSFPANPLLTPANGETIPTFEPVFDWLDAADPDEDLITYTLIVTGSEGFTALAAASITTTESIYTPTTALPSGVYTWTVQASDAAGSVSDTVEPYTFTIQATGRSYLPLVIKAPPAVCPTGSEASFTLIPVDGPAADHPDYLHGDLNLDLRGYETIVAFPGLVDYSGASDSNAPQLAGLFNPNRYPGIRAVYRAYSWNWACGEHGCPGPLITSPEVTLVGLNTTRGEPIYIPERGPGIYNDFKVLVLYAEEQQITLGYTRRDTVATGYAVHLENVCVDPNLLALYRAQVDAEGGRATRTLPALRHNQALGTALSNELIVAIRDRGSFGDPRSRKDWWQGY
jgi:hypothetical protein